VIQHLLTEEGSPSALLPYTPVEYLRSPGAQYIDSGICPDDSTGAMACFCAESKIGQFNYPAGAMYDDGSARFYVPGVTANVGGAAFGWNASTFFVNGGVNPLLKAVSSLNYLNNREAAFDNGVHSYRADLSTPLYPVDLPIHIFGVNRDGSNVTNFDMRIYYVIISKGTNIVRHFVPALDAAGTPCMWDKISRSFFYNIGTGAFIVP